MNPISFLRQYLYFGEQVEEYPVRVINEREARAAAGMLFVLAFAAFMHAWLTANFNYERLLIIALGLEMFIRVFINPKYAPFMILARLIVRNQRVEYTGAPQKRVAWGLGLAIAVFMYWLVFIEANLGIANFAGCVTCATLLFFESTFGICLGCVLYNLACRQSAQLCPGGVCEVKQIEPIQRVSWLQIILVILFIGFIVSIPTFNLLNVQNPDIITPENFDTIDFDKIQ